MTVLAKLSPKITNLIRMDHTKVLAAFHQYEIGSPAALKEALVATACLGIEIHAQLEEEIFYPAIQAVDPNVVEKSVPEHDHMRRLIGALRGMDATHGAYDATFMELMRLVIHHVADEETILLPHAEKLLEDRLSELGAQMNARRLELMRERAGELVRNRINRTSVSTRVFAGLGVLAASGYILRHALRR